MPLFAAVSPHRASRASPSSRRGSLTLSIVENIKKKTSKSKKLNFDGKNSYFAFLNNPKSSKLATAYHFIIEICAVASCLVLFLRTLDGPNHGGTQPLYPSFPSAETYWFLDAVFTIIFSLEFFVRLVIWPSLWQNNEFLSDVGHKPFAKDFFNWFDFASIIPWYLDVVFGPESSIVVLRLCRLLRIFKIARNHSGTYILLRAIISSYRAISIAMVFFLEIVIFFGAVIYLVDPCYNKDECHFPDLFTCMYFTVVTISTVGYGDLFPSEGNIMSRTATIAIMILGTLFLSMPLAIIGTEFDRAWKDFVSEKREDEALKGVQVTKKGNDQQIIQVYQQLSKLSKKEVIESYEKPNSSYLDLCSAVGDLLSHYTKFEKPTDETEEIDLMNMVKDKSLVVYGKIMQLNKKLKCVVHKDVSVENTPIVETSILDLLKEGLNDEIQTDQAHKSVVRKFLRWMIILSLMVTVGETMPEFQIYGESTSFCENIVEDYCKTGVNSSADPGCYTAQFPIVPIKFHCTSMEDKTNPACFRYGLNFGSTLNSSLTCKGSGTNRKKPFRTSKKLKQVGHDICHRFQCWNDHVIFTDLSFAWESLEAFLALVFVSEHLLRWYFMGFASSYLKNKLFWIDFLSVLQFFIIEVNDRLILNKTPNYAISPGNLNPFIIFRLLRVLQVYKYYKSIPGTHVLWEAISMASQRLMIPYFVLGMASLILTFIIFELEKGFECYYGNVCYGTNGKIIEYPSELIGTIHNKRILINAKGELSTFQDFFSGFWFTIVTITSVGYGDMYPLTIPGKMFAVISMLFGACYTAMPLTLVGGQFRRSYCDYERCEEFAITAEKINNGLYLSTDECSTWRDFLKFEASFQNLIGKMDMTESKCSEKINEIEDNLKNLKHLTFRMSHVVRVVRDEGVRLARQQKKAENKF